MICSKSTFPHFFLILSGRYGDNINEMGWAVRSIIKELEDQQLTEKTLVVFMSDHGPHLEYCLEGGDPGIFRGKSVIRV